MLAKDKFLKKQTNLLLIKILFFIILFSKNTIGEQIDSKVENYIKNLNDFSSKFIQSNGVSLDEGSIYIKDAKIRLDYFYPDRTLIISKKKGVYINHELKEENFFSTEKNIVSLFYDIFLDYNFLTTFAFKENNEEIVFEKKFTIDSKITNLQIFFENKPFLIRKITTKTENEIVSVSFSEHNYNNNFDESLFSFVPMYINK